MRIIIIRTHATSFETNFYDRSYNIQEIGIAKALNLTGHECDVVFWGRDKNTSVDVEYKRGSTFKVYFMKGIRLFSDIFFFGLDDLVSHYDIIHTNEYDQMFSWYLAWRYPDKTIIYHGPYYCDFNKKYNLKCKFVDLFYLGTYKRNRIPFATKSKLSEDFLSHKGIANIETIGVGLDSYQMVSDSANSSELLDELSDSVKNGCQLLLYVGKLEPRRNIPFLLDVFTGINRTHPNTRLVIIGGGEKKYMRNCREIADKMRISDKIIYRASLSQKLLPAIYNICHVFLFPTLYDIFGMVLLEAMFFGCVPVSSYNGGAEMLIRNKANGIVLRSMDAREWIDSVNRLIEDPVTLGLYSNEASAVIRKRYTWETLVASLLVIYQSKFGLKNP